MIEVGSYWRCNIPFLRALIVKVLSITDKDVKVSVMNSEINIDVFLKYYTILTPLEMELL